MIKDQSLGRNCDLKYVCIKEQSLKIYEGKTNINERSRQIQNYNTLKCQHHTLSN